MKAAYIEKVGPSKNIIFGDLPKPKPNDSQVLVKVAAVAVNPVDTYIRAGTVEMDLPMPFILGCDLAGVVEEVGEKAKRFKVGDRVWCSNQGLLGRQGTYAEYAAVEECWLYPTPEEVSDNDAAALAMVGITAHLGVFRNGGVKMGDTLLVNGGTGGVGACAVQMGRTIGARVFATAGTSEKVKRCRKLGAAASVSYKGSGFDGAIRKFAPEGIDVWFETRRDPDFKQIVEHLAPGGRIILMAGREATPEFPVGPFYTKDCRMFGFAMFNTPAQEQRKCAAEINRWMARERLKANIDRVMPLEKAAAAHKLQEQNTLRGAGTLAGKIVLTP